MMFIEFVTLHSNLLLCWHGFRDINVTVNVRICWRRQSCFYGCLVNLTICNTTYDWPTNHSPPNIIHDQLLIWTTRDQFIHSLWLLKKTVLMRQFFYLPTVYFLVEKYKKYFYKSLKSVIYIKFIINIWAKIVIFCNFLSNSLKMCFGCSKELSHRHDSFEYPQH